MGVFLPFAPPFIELLSNEAVEKPLSNDDILFSVVKCYSSDNYLK
jgi:hypothetical protein